MKIHLQPNTKNTLLLSISTAALLLFSQCKKDLVSPQLQAAIGTGASVEKLTAISTNSVISPTPFKNMLNVNGYEWNFLQNPADHNDVSQIFEPKMALIEGFSGIRHYLDWSKVEYNQGNYTFNPSHDGSWNLDAIYARCKQDGIFMLVDMKDCPQWLQYTYPSSMWNVKDNPTPYGNDLSQPSSYIMQAKAAFQFAARYGSNANIDPSLVKVDTTSRWINDPANVVKIGLNQVSYMECDNERDNWWIGSFASQTAEQYAADLSAFYDGDQGRLGPNVGVKTADPNMKVVLGGLATANVQYVQAIVDWCRVHRGYKADGTIDICFDVINYHWYANDGNVLLNTVATTGVAPELNPAGTVADGFVQLASTLSNHPEVWVTEAGYDINQHSQQRAIPIGSKTAQLTQGDWIARTALLYARHGIKRLFFYQMFDDTANGPVTFQTSGLLNDNLTRRPSANYILQMKTLLGDYSYNGSLSTDPFVDQYVNGSKTIYALVVPDQQGRTAQYTLDLGKAYQVYVYSLNPYSNNITRATKVTTGGKLTLTVTETPQFVQVVN